MNLELCIKWLDEFARDYKDYYIDIRRHHDGYRAEIGNWKHNDINGIPRNITAYTFGGVVTKLFDAWKEFSRNPPVTSLICPRCRGSYIFFIPTQETKAYRQVGRRVFETTPLADGVLELLWRDDNQEDIEATGMSLKEPNKDPRTMAHCFCGHECLLEVKIVWKNKPEGSPNG